MNRATFGPDDSGSRLAELIVSRLGGGPQSEGASTISRQATGPALPGLGVVAGWIRA